MPAVVLPTVTPQQAVTAFAKQAYAHSQSEAASAAIVVPPDHDTLKVAIDRTSFPAVANGDLLYCRAECSLDGGKTWSPKPNGDANWQWGIFPVEFTVAGGAFIDGGVTITESTVILNLPAVGNASRRVRIAMRPFQNCTTQISVLSANGPVK